MGFAQVGRQRAFADRPSATHKLAGGTSFAVLATPVVSDMLVLNAGLNLDVSANTTLHLTHDGRVGGGAQTHALKAAWNTMF